jgi:hypothetical protein
MVARSAAGIRTLGRASLDRCGCDYLDTHALLTVMTIPYLFIYLLTVQLPYCVSTSMDCGPRHEIVIEKLESLADLNAFIRKYGIEGTVVNMTDGYTVKISTQPIYKTITEEKRVIDYYVWDVK